MREECFPDLHTADGIGNRGVGDAVPFDAEAGHRVGQTCVLDVGAVLMYVADEFVGTATDLRMKRLALLFGFVDIFDVAVVGRNAVSDEVT